MKKSSQLLSHFFEPVFYRFDDGYWSEDCPDADRLEHYLITKIRNDNKDLDSHVQRILLNIEFQRKPQLIGALQDLYLSLGRQGEPIKNNLLNRSQALLSSESLDNFRVATGQEADYTPIKIPHSYLYQELISTSLAK